MQDGELVNNMGEINRENASRFRQDAIVNDWINLVRCVVSE